MVIIVFIDDVTINVAFNTIIIIVIIIIGVVTRETVLP